ncbi:hypothetical protein HY933_00135 [Candidatus Falkowbacteria bacterium]|nr:hypothetical protein [Candidatus Falkowbacteria bacterium]
MKLLSDQRGMSMIEIMTSVSIIILLANIVLTATVQAKIKTRDTIRIRDLQEVQRVLDIYYQDHGRYPWIDGESGWRGSCADVAWGTPTTDWIPLVIEQGLISYLPQDPLSTQNRCYLYHSNGTDYKVLAYGEDMHDQKFLVFVDPARDGGTQDDVLELDGELEAWSLYTVGARSW